MYKRQYQDGTNYYFVHRSFQEYFAAYFFSKQLEQNFDAVLDMLLARDESNDDSMVLPMLYAMDKMCIRDSIDMITARLDMRRNIYIASFSNLGIDNVLLEDEYPEKFDRLLCGGIWCIVPVSYTHLDVYKRQM